MSSLKLIDVQNNVDFDMPKMDIEIVDISGFCIMRPIISNYHYNNDFDIKNAKEELVDIIRSEDRDIFQSYRITKSDAKSIVSFLKNAFEI